MEKFHVPFATYAAEKRPIPPNLLPVVRLTKDRKAKPRRRPVAGKGAESLATSELKTNSQRDLEQTEYNFSEQTKFTDENRKAQLLRERQALFGGDDEKASVEEEVEIDEKMVWDPNNILTSCMPYQKYLEYFDESIENETGENGGMGVWVKRDISDPYKYMPRKNDRMKLGVNEFCDIGKHMQPKNDQVQYQTWDV